MFKEINFAELCIKIHFIYLFPRTLCLLSRWS